jgi:hypothetical protein
MTNEPSDAVALAYVHDVDVAYSFHHSLTNLLMFDAAVGAGRIMRGGYLACRYGTGGIVDARNKVAGQFVDTEAEWLFWLDTDMGFEADTLEKLLAVADPVDRPIVGGLAFAQKEVVEDGMSGWRCAPRATILDWRDVDGVKKFVGRAHYPVNALVQCSATGSACLIVHRSVFEKIGERWYDPIVTDEGPIGEDISFCARAGAAGFPIFVHTGVRTSHRKHTWVAEPDYWEKLVVPPATDPVAVLIPVMRRPENVAPLVASLRASTGLAKPYFVVDAADTAERAAVLAAGATEIAVGFGTPGTFAEKINEGYRQTSEPWLFLVGDDVRFRPGWLDHAQEVARIYGVDVVGTNDMANPRTLAGEHSTHLMVRRSYIDEQGASWDGPGVVCHGYGHWYVDDEIVTVAKQRGVWGMALGSFVEHLHPIVGKADMDDVYEIGQRRAPADRAEFERRVKRFTA